MIEHFKIKQTLKLWNEFKYYADYWNQVAVRNNLEGAFKLLHSVTYLRFFLNYICVFGLKVLIKHLFAMLWNCMLIVITVLSRLKGNFLNWIYIFSLHGRILYFYICLAKKKSVGIKLLTTLYLCFYFSAIGQ